MELIPEAIARLPERSEELRSQLRSWCEIGSGSGNVPGLARMAGVLKAACASLTDDLSETPVGPEGALILGARKRPEAPVQVLLSGHYDTVYAADDAFQRCEILDNGMLRGPGVADMKGGLVVMLAALEAFERTHESAQLGWEIVLVPDEETGSVRSRAYLEEAAKRHALGLVYEAARENGDLVLARKGVGSAVACCRGRSSHAGNNAGDGRNAIMGLSEFLLNAKRLAHDLPRVGLNVGRICGGGPLNRVPDQAEAHFDVRVEDTADWEELRRRLESCAAPINHREGFHIGLDLRLSRPPMKAAAASLEAFGEISRSAKALQLVPFGWQSVGGGSDANLLSAAGLPCLDGLGPRGGAFHSDREWVDPFSLTDRAQLSACLLHALATRRLSLGRIPPTSLSPLPSPA